MRYILLILCFLPSLMWAQRRYSASEEWEHRLAEKSGFSTKDVDGQTDVLFGLHASQYTGSHHLIGVSAEGAWSAMLTNMPSVAMSPTGWGAGLKFVYEYQYSGFLFQTGLGVTYQHVANSISDTTIYHENMQDPWSSVKDVPFTLRHSFYDRQDQAQNVYAQLPLYAGHYILGSLGIGYFLAGVNVNYAFWGTTRQTLTGSTAGLYERYIGVWEEMDNHGFRKDVPIERTGERLKLKIDLMAHAEIGYEYTTFQNAFNYRSRPGDRLDCRIRFAAFADFGILNICPKTDKPYYAMPESTIYDFSTYQMAHAFATKDAQAYWLRNVYAGVRITVLFGFPGKEKCILCDPWKH